MEEQERLVLTISHSKSSDVEVHMGHDVNRRARLVTLIEPRVTESLMELT